MLATQVLEFVDANTRNLLEKTKDVAEINKILKSPNVRFQQRARCLRHPMKTGGCELPCNIDMDSKLIKIIVFNSLLFIFFEWLVLETVFDSAFLINEDLGTATVDAQESAGVTCKDDSPAGSRKEDEGASRRAALTYWRPASYPAHTQYTLNTQVVYLILCPRNRKMKLQQQHAWHTNMAPADTIWKERPKSWPVRTYAAVRSMNFAAQHSAKMDSTKLKLSM